MILRHENALKAMYKCSKLVTVLRNLMRSRCAVMTQCRLARFDRSTSARFCSLTAASICTFSDLSTLHIPTMKSSVLLAQIKLVVERGFAFRKRSSAPNAVRCIHVGLRSPKTLCLKMRATFPMSAQRVCERRNMTVKFTTLYLLELMFCQGGLVALSWRNQVTGACQT
ncbi:hypothetical protein BU23DRAFT_212286 [Bimuria novae-zelandiae CBS 107.79]|uniref:Uncharacterized protein n=1 Tax=Bimuria novae-zelandiae CBS 107.79 TaxID=1447943 RepID=A0A6A5V0K3_9PLEO|nr:hypothetical protein BU23DRAFT_212286 [Bimuria novae-zelandiae CBS 107.79]